ncbi:sugar MFS transporter [Acinetobacter sp. ANC 4173]|uniref:sugar MFS transporter n=1 Tax=Acinetobacter sp. ANC 4173 TaxID=2529837 RepID=UPI00103C27E2|nr:sugar MFS transporter [Acinetobacter sp. ANC 4173]TCB77220.1 glucose/galactose MFS transporter [Acinetobacter sp. ANC 4173]
MSNSTILKNQEYQQNVQSNNSLKIMVFALFFLFGSITSLNDVLIPKLKDIFQLTYMEAMLVQSAFFFAYFVASIPASRLIYRFGYIRSAIIGLAVMGIGCLAFIPATKILMFPAFLSALFILAVGVTVIQVVTNPLLAHLGKAESVSSRLTLGHAFNSLGTTVAPYFGAIIILGSIATVDITQLNAAEMSAYLQKEASVISNAYTGIAIVIGLSCILLARFRNYGPKSIISKDHKGLTSSLRLLKSPRFALGFICLFLYVGAEVTIGSLLVSYLSQSDIMDITAEHAGKLVAFYWGGAMIARFLCSALMRVITPAKLLALFSIAVMSLLFASSSLKGDISGIAILSVGFFNSIMFPTIFSLASKHLSERAAEGSGILCCGIVGGAIIPPLTGYVADMSSLSMSLFVPIACYLGILVFSVFCSKQGD